MFSQEEFVNKAFAIAKSMMSEPLWAVHIIGVDHEFIRFKNGKNVDAEKLEKMRCKLLRVELIPRLANPIIMAATKNQPCVNVPMVEIVRRMRAE